MQYISIWISKKIHASMLNLFCCTKNCELIASKSICFTIKYALPLYDCKSLVSNALLTTYTNLIPLCRVVTSTLIVQLGQVTTIPLSCVAFHIISPSHRIVQFWCYHPLAKGCHTPTSLIWRFILSSTPLLIPVNTLVFLTKQKIQLVAFQTSRQNKESFNPGVIIP